MKKIFTLLAVLCIATFQLSAQEGALDPTFNALNLSGKITFRPNFSAVDAVQQSDGKFVVAVVANGLSIMRINVNGTIDSAFGTNGSATINIGTSSQVRAIALQSDGKIVVAGQANVFGNDDFAIARFNANGTPDLTFSGDGVAVSGVGSGTTDIGWGLAIQSDGKIVVVGTTSANGTDWAMMRINADGSLDTSFSNGQVTQSTGNDGLYTVAIQSDGKIVVGGYAFQSNEQRTALARFTASGAYDTTFNANGIKIEDYGTGNQNWNSVKIQSDGKIVAAGSMSSGAGIIGRYNSNGTNDNTFDSDGRVSITNISTRQAFLKLEIQADGKLICAGYAGANVDKDDFFVARLQTNGAFDPTFGTGGYSLTDFFGQTDQVWGLAIDGSGKIFVAGVADNIIGTIQIGIAQYNANGTLDNTFAARVEGSPNIRDLALGNDEIRDLALQPDGKIVAVGIYFGVNQDWGLARYNSNGTNDSTFGTNGIASLALVSGANEVATSVALQQDGKIVVAGYTVQSGTNRLALARFNSNGTIDNSFAGGQGFLISNIPSSEAYDVMMIPDNEGADSKILVAGWVNDAQDDFELFRYNLDGTPDITFGSSGQVSIDFGGVSNEVAYALARQPDGKILVGGSSNTAGGIFAVARLNQDGTLDNTFDTDGKQTVNIISTGTNNDVIRSIAVQNDGKIVLGGAAANTSNGVSNNFALARLKSNGSLDSTFGTNGQLVTDFNGLEDGCEGVVILADGKILAGGYSVTGGNNDTRQFAVARYNSNGTLDNTFGTNGRSQIDAGGVLREDFGYAMAVQPNGRILIGGRSRINTMDFSLVGLIGSVAPAPFGYLPILTNITSSNITGSSATLSGTVNTNSTVLTDLKFAFGTNPNNLTDSISVTPNLIGSMFSGVTFTANVSGLNQTTRYYYRLIARNVVGTIQSDEYSFFTSLSNPEISTNGLQLWLRGDLFVDTTASGKVSSWKNVMNPTIEAKQSVDNSRPTYVANGLNGKPMVSFSGPTRLIADSIRLGAFTVITVFNSTQQVFRHVWEHNVPINASNSQNYAYLTNSSINGNVATATLITSREPVSTTQYGFLTPNWANDSQFRIASARFTGTFSLQGQNLQLFLNGALQTLSIGSIGSTPTSLEVTNPFFIPAKFEGNVLVGNIAEVIAYNRALSTTERDSVERYLSLKYNIPLTISSTNDDKNTIPKIFDLVQNYPNPFNPSTRIAYQLPTAQMVQLDVFDILGRKVTTLVNQRQNAGRYEANFNASQLSSGVYFYRLQAGSFTKTMKMMLVK